jgi:hypothetical protein
MGQRLAGRWDLDHVLVGGVCVCVCVCCQPLRNRWFIKAGLLMTMMMTAAVM